MSPSQRSRSYGWLISVLVLFLVAAGPVGAEQVEWNVEPQEIFLDPALPAFPVQLVLDDDSVEGSFGIASGVTARQFMWFNQFSLAGEGFVDLREIWVYFPPGPNMAAGGAIQIAIFHDPDGDPTNGADLLTTFNDTIQVVDGNTFSIYPITPLSIPPGGNLLVGVINRFVVSGVTSNTDPAALDTTASQGRSWVAVWTGDPPASPELPPDLFIDQVDTFISGNFTIRAFGVPQSVLEIPTLDLRALSLLSLLIAALALGLLRR